MATVDAYGTPIGGQTRNPFNYVKVEQLARDNTTAWLTLTEITNQLNLFSDSSQDVYLQAIELATRQAIEDYLGLSIFATTYRVWYGTESLVASPVCFDLPEVSQNSNSALSGVTISFVKYYNDAFPPVVTTISNTEYFYDNSGNKVIVNNMPTSVNTVMTAPIYIDYVTAANPMAAYPVIKQAGLLLLTHLYNNRSNTTDIQLKDIPFGVANLLRPYKPLVM
jgi:hypothetical protein